jgi:hypothetical protein
VLHGGIYTEGVGLEIGWSTGKGGDEHTWSARLTHSAGQRMAAGTKADRRCQDTSLAYLQLTTFVFSWPSHSPKGGGGAGRIHSPPPQLFSTAHVRGSNLCRMSLGGSQQAAEAARYRKRNRRPTRGADGRQLLGIALRFGACGKRGGGVWHDAMVCCSRLQLAAPTGPSPFAALSLDPFPP